MKKRPSAQQLGLEFSDTRRPWPAPERFPHNADGHQVGEQVVRDLVSSSQPLIIAGYASVERLLALIDQLHRGEWVDLRDARARVLIGVEPRVRPDMRLPLHVGPLELEIRDYWLNQGVSVRQWPALFVAMDLIDQRRLEVKYSGQRRTHAKVFVGEYAATLGSSNFTDQGLSTNLEANARFQRDLEESRFRETVDFAENLWTLGRDSTESFRDLLAGLLRRVTWREALARACAELLEGDWAGGADGAPWGSSALWPSQEQGIAQALWVLENVGSVLIADATGAGKTRMGACLIRALGDRNLRSGRSPTLNPVLICPPATRHRWKMELLAARQSMNVISHGLLSRSGALEGEVVERMMDQAQLLAVDEAHNFLNRTSTRSRWLHGNAADHVILLTATPINRGVADLVSIVDLLGADNFDDDVLDIVGRLARPGGMSASLSGEEANRMRGALRTFVVRRTKRDFNELIDQAPESYHNALGDKCRFPKHRALTFKRDDPAGDRSSALKIREHAKNLRGLVNLRRIEPRYLAFEGWNEELFLAMRLKGAAALASYHIRSRLRSSRAALIEHLAGTRAAMDRFGIGDFKSSPTGDVISTLAGYRTELPEAKMSIALPPWLTDPDEYATAITEEIETYEAILSLALGMSDHRTNANAQYLTTLLDRHERVLAFDSHPISLFELESRLKGMGVDEVALATGAKSVNARLKFADRFGLEGGGSRLVGLCSDALSEGLNLQGASALVHLDLPTVVRVLEQRIGRVDRMDSPHAEVEVHWPEEPAEFAMQSDDRLFLRLRAVDELLGSNVPLPVELESYANDSREELRLSELIQVVETSLEEGPEVTLADAFGRVRGLVSGPDALVSTATYAELRHSKARVLSCVSVVSAPHAWTFLAIGAADRSVPRWLLVDLEDPSEPDVVTDLDEVAIALRERLRPSIVDLGFDQRAADVLSDGLSAANGRQRALLPRRKQRALDEMRFVLGKYAKKSDAKPDRRAVISELLSLVGEKAIGDIDLHRVAEWWLGLIRPRWLEYLAGPRIKRPVQLKALRKNLVDKELPTADLQSMRQVALEQLPLERRVVAAIVGVPGGRPARS